MVQNRLCTILDLRVLLFQRVRVRVHPYLSYTSLSICDTYQIVAPIFRYRVGDWLNRWNEWVCVSRSVRGVRDSGAPQGLL